VFALARKRDGDRLSLAASIAASLLLSPIVWLHYFVLLLVPLALARPRLTAAWVILPLPFWFSSANGQSHGHAGAIVLALATASAILLVSASRSEGRIVRSRARVTPAPSVR
jgi:hypothetical protein